MDYNAITTLISTIGFPIVACCAMGVYVKDTVKEYREDIKLMTQQHKDEMNSITEALTNNTIALQNLCSKLDRDNSKGESV